ncbi:MAG TPA: type I restriction enzyme HsdR N-terminal domain-containing protein [Fulvivirga sp.]|nr:type I restriction enzyme HsdR N-terminal domain-containing protein [Fulvivirga sp.]
MLKLNLPEFQCNIRKNEGNIEIFDIIRKKYVILQPEEWVRQHIVHYLINHLNYPKSLIKVESGLYYNKLSKRTDVVAYNPDGTSQLLVECKSFNVKINQLALDQLSLYNAKLKSKYLLLTNGINHFCCELSERGDYKFIDNIPNYK